LQGCVTTRQTQTRTNNTQISPPQAHPIHRRVSKKHCKDSHPSLPTMETTYHTIITLSIAKQCSRLTHPTPPPCRTWSGIDELVDMIVGPEGSTVAMQLQRGQTTMEKTVRRSRTVFSPQLNVRRAHAGTTHRLHSGPPNIFRLGCLVFSCVRLPCAAKPHTCAPCSLHPPHSFPTLLPSRLRTVRPPIHGNLRVPRPPTAVVYALPLPSAMAAATVHHRWCLAPARSPLPVQLRGCHRLLHQFEPRMGRQIKQKQQQGREGALETRSVLLAALGVSGAGRGWVWC